jgi:hypothetical protein
LLSGHLYEAGKAFRNLEETSPGQLDKVANDQEMKADLNYLRQVYATTPDGAFHYAFLKPMRNYFGFHYTGRHLREALERHKKAKDLEGNLIVAGFSGFGRYSVADHLAVSATQQLLGATQDNLHQRYAEATDVVVKLAWALFRIVDNFLLQIFMERQDAIIEQQDGEIVVRSEILAAADKPD